MSTNRLDSCCWRREHICLRCAFESSMGSKGQQTTNPDYRLPQENMLVWCRRRRRHTTLSPVSELWQRFLPRIPAASHQKVSQDDSIHRQSDIPQERGTRQTIFSTEQTSYQDSMVSFRIPWSQPNGRMLASRKGQRTWINIPQLIWELQKRNIKVLSDKSIQTWFV